MTLISPACAMGEPNSMAAARAARVRVITASAVREDGRQSSVPIPKFASICGRLLCELRNQRDTSKYYASSALLNPKFAIGPAAKWCELRVQGTRAPGRLKSRLMRNEANVDNRGGGRLGVGRPATRYARRRLTFASWQR